MREAIKLRAKLVRAMREQLDGDGFIEIETPVLTRSTPEGARDFLVPSRLQQGSFYALPQSPQLFKQLLMVSGFERYYQIARCFRDEDLRADRQPDFTQLDIEMSFVEVDDVIEANERLMKHVLAVAGVEIELPIERIPYDEALSRFGTDRPDTRFGMELVELSDALRETEFRVFRATIDGGGVVKGMNCGKRELPRAQLDGLIGEAQDLGAKGLVWAFREGDGWRSPTAKFLTADELAALNSALGAAEGDLLLVVADEPAVANQVLGTLRRRLAERWDEIPADANSLCWIVDWPLLRVERGRGRLEPAPPPLHVLRGRARRRRPRRVRARAYDLVWNGWEIGGGSIRISDSSEQEARPRAARDRRRGGRGALRLPARGAALRRARRTAGSPTGSTGSAPSPPGRTRSAT